MLLPLLSLTVVNIYLAGQAVNLLIFDMGFFIAHN